MKTKTAPGLKEIQEARARLDGIARVTPVYGTETLSRIIGREESRQLTSEYHEVGLQARGQTHIEQTLRR